MIHKIDRESTIHDYRLLGYQIVALEYDKRYEMTEMSQYVWSDKTLLLAGEEGRSIPPEILDLVDDIVYIYMTGTVRSLNLASAVSIAMYDYNTKIARRY